METSMDIYDTISQIITGQGSRFTTVEFIKKDGTVRTMRVQPAATKFRVKGEDAPEHKQRAAETRRINHPNLLNIYDVDRDAIRSIDMNTIMIVRGSGTVLYRNPFAFINWLVTRAA
jgi:hypothetical protein